MTKIIGSAPWKFTAEGPGIFRAQLITLQKLTDNTRMRIVYGQTNKKLINAIYSTRQRTL